MDGKDFRFGAVASIGERHTFENYDPPIRGGFFTHFAERVPHAIEVALKVMTDTEHCMIVGDGATKFAEKQGSFWMRIYYFHRDFES